MAEGLRCDTCGKFSTHAGHWMRVNLVNSDELAWSTPALSGDYCSLPCLATATQHAVEKAAEKQRKIDEVRAENMAAFAEEART